MQDSSSLCNEQWVNGPLHHSVKANKHALSAQEGQIGIGWDDQKEGGRVYHSRPSWKGGEPGKQVRACASSLLLYVAVLRPSLTLHKRGSTLPPNEVMALYPLP